MPFQDFDSASAEGVYSCYLTVPYADATYQLESSLWDSIPSIYNDLWVYTTGKEYEKFSLDMAWFTPYPASYAHIKTYGGCSWYTEGYVSDDTYFHLMNGDTWSGEYEEWNGIIRLFKIETGSRSLTLSPGTYRVTLVGRGGDYGYDASSNNYYGSSSGGSGGTIIATFVIDENISAEFIVDDVNRCSKMVLGDDEMLNAGYGKDAGRGWVYAGDGGVNAINEDFDCDLIVNENGKLGNHTTGYKGSIPATEVYSRYAEIYGTRHGNSASCSYATRLQYPGNALIILEKIHSTQTN